MAPAGFVSGFPISGTPRRYLGIARPSTVLRLRNEKNSGHFAAGIVRLSGGRPSDSGAKLGHRRAFRMRNSRWRDYRPACAGARLRARRPRPRADLGAAPRPPAPNRARHPSPAPPSRAGTSPAPPSPGQPRGRAPGTDAGERLGISKEKRPRSGTQINNAEHNANISRIAAPYRFTSLPCISLGVHSKVQIGRCLRKGAARGFRCQRVSRMEYGPAGGTEPRQDRGPCGGSLAFLWCAAFRRPGAVTLPEGETGRAGALSGYPGRWVMVARLLPGSPGPGAP
jgi:hypothetical protein